MLFFALMMLFLSFIFYDRMRDERDNIRNSVYLELQNYSLGSDSTEGFREKEVARKKEQKYYTLYEDNDGLYILVPMPTDDPKKMMPVMGPTGMMFVPYSSSDTKARKIWYPKEAFQERLAEVRLEQLWQFALFVLIALLISGLAAWYTLRPLRSSLHLMEEFIKDMIHDLNTPLSAIMLNLNMLETENEEIEGIRTAAQTIQMLHHNLDAYLKENRQPKERFDVREIIESQVAFFGSLCDHLVWEVELESVVLFTDKQAFNRIVYNLLNNACKYNTNEGKVQIVCKENVLTIRNNSYGVKNPQRVFDRFYKESERGLGIGLHIVDKLCRQIDVAYSFKVEDTDVIVSLACEKIVAQKSAS